MAHLYIMSAIYVQYVPICPACEEIKTDLSYFFEVLFAPGHQCQHLHMPA